LNKPEDDDDDDEVNSAVVVSDRAGLRGTSKRAKAALISHTPLGKRPVFRLDLVNILVALLIMDSKGIVGARETKRPSVPA
jgi:hypothetical protein